MRGTQLLKLSLASIKKHFHWLHSVAIISGCILCHLEANTYFLDAIHNQFCYCHFHDHDKCPLTDLVYIFLVILFCSSFDFPFQCECPSVLLLSTTFDHVAPSPLLAYPLHSFSDLESMSMTFLSTNTLKFFIL